MKYLLQVDQRGVNNKLGNAFSCQHFPDKKIENFDRNEMAKLIVLLRKIREHSPYENSIIQAICKQFHLFRVIGHYGVVTKIVAAIKNTSYTDKRGIVQGTLDTSPKFSMVNQLLVVDNFKGPWDMTMVIYAANQLNSKRDDTVNSKILWGRDILHKETTDNKETNKYILPFMVVRDKNNKYLKITKTKGAGNRMHYYQVEGKDGTFSFKFLNHLYRKYPLCLMFYQSGTTFTANIANNCGGSKEIPTSIEVVDDSSSRSCMSDVVEIFFHIVQNIPIGPVGFTFNPDAVALHNQFRGKTDKFPFGILRECAITSKESNRPGGNIHVSDIEFFFRRNGRVLEDNKVLVLRQDDVGRFKLNQRKPLILRKNKVL